MDAKGINVPGLTLSSPTTGAASNISTSGVTANIQSPVMASTPIPQPIVSSQPVPSQSIISPPVSTIPSSTMSSSAKEKAPSSLGWVVAIALLVIILVLVGVWLALEYQKYHSCTSGPNLRCWSSFTCAGPAGSAPVTIDVEGIYNNLAHICQFDS